MEKPTVLAAWVCRCDECGTCYTLPRFPISSHIEGQVVLRPDKFDKQPLACFCGQTFTVDRDALSYVLLGVLMISRLSSDEFQVEQDFAGSKTNLGPMSDIELEGYLKSRALLGILPEQVLARLDSQPEVSVQMEVMIVRPGLAAKA